MRKKRYAQAAFLFVVFLSLATVMQQADLAAANFLPPPPELPHAYIRSDGSIEPQTLPIQQAGNVYTLTGNIHNYTLEIQKANIILDGAGYTLQGNSSGKGIFFNCSGGVTVKNFVITNFRTGIDVEQSSGNTITATTIASTELGLALNYAQNNLISKNQITANSQTAILLYACCDFNRIEENNITKNGNGIWCEFPGNYSNTNDGNSIIGNNITSNSGTGIILRGCAYDTIERNNISHNNCGIRLSGTACTNNTIAGNQLVGNTESNINISADSKYGTITQNHIANSAIGIYIFNSNNTEIYLNNFVDNQKQVANGETIEPDGVLVGLATNFWDKNNQGNYWSDRGDANGTYVIDALNVDHYPLSSPASTELPATENPLLFMPEEYLNYTITSVNGTLWAIIDGVYPMHLSPEPIVLPMVYPMPPETINIHIKLDGAELPWENYSTIDPAARHPTDIGNWEMIYCTVNPSAADFLLEIHYEHPLQVINGSYTFLYDLNISPYLSALSPTSTAYFTVQLPTNESELKLYTTGYSGDWSPKNYNSTLTALGETVTFNIVSVYDKPLNGDLAFILSGIVVPEFPAWTAALLFMVSSLVAVFCVKRSLRRP
ncbi:MAG: right-handed parallel beta-helix repeat-containing protein [Candidatus Bathyarchaeota archaeon]|nr:right-handed parallel beta-helix repeat-containing protein [Candidatus Bathyarchaeota archaeon]